jgi:hypothetical protein
VPPLVIVAVVDGAQPHVPPVVASANNVVLPWHTCKVPVMAATGAITFIIWLTEQPPAVVYIIVTTPALTPVTRPVAGFTVAFVTSLLLHVPPLTLLESEVVPPVHTTEAPDITPGDGLTDTSLVT